MNYKFYERGETNVQKNVWIMGANEIKLLNCRNVGHKQEVM